MEDSKNIFYLKEEKVSKAIRHLAIPTMIGMSVGTIYNILNAYFIGLTKSTLFLAVVTLGLSIFIILMAFGNMIGVGAGTYISRLLGENDFSKAKKIAKYATYGSIVFSILVAIICLIFINPIVRVIGATGVAFAPTKAYAEILFIGGFSVICNFTLEQLVRSEGATKESMYGMVISVIFSIIFDILFILVFKWNVYGAGLSMVLANITACIYYFYYLNFKSETLRGYLKSEGWINLKEQFEIFKIGFPELIQCTFILVTMLLINNFSMNYGDSIMAGFGIALRVSQLPDFLSMGLCLGAIPLIAYNFGGKNYGRLKEAIKICLVYVIIISAFFIILVFLFKGTILKLFSTNPEVLTDGGKMLIAMLIAALFTGLTTLFTVIFQGSGDGMLAGIISVAQGLIYVPVVIGMNYYLGLQGLIWSSAVSGIASFVIAIILFLIYLKKLNKLEKAVE